LNLRIRTDWLLLAGFCLFLFFYGLGSFGLVGADEPRYAQVAREMFQRHDWITPTLGAKAWLEKPALYYWQAEVSYAIFGVHDWAARLPSAFDASLMVFAVYWFLRRLRAAVALDGALMVASTAGIVGFARAAGTDMPLTAMLTIALLSWYAWWETRSRTLLAWFYVFLALATLAKGPVALFLAGAIIALFAWAAGRSKIVLDTLWLPGMLLLLVVMLPWYIAVQLHNPEFFRVFILEHNLARFGTNLYRHQQPFWFFVPVAFLSLIPWAILACASLWESCRGFWAERSRIFDSGTAGSEDANSGDALSVFLMLWLVVPVIFFSVSQSKLPGYILPAIPAGPLLVAEYLRRHMEETVRPALIAIHALLAGALLVPAFLIQYLLLEHRIPMGTGLIVSSIAGILVAAGISMVLRQAGWAVLRTATLVPVVVALAAMIRLGGTAADLTLSARPVATELKRLQQGTFPIAVFGVSRETEYGLAFYRNQRIARYADGELPQDEHVLVTRHDQQAELAKVLGRRDVVFLGTFDPQSIDFYRVLENDPAANK
jgi:4-amino-4-deoxy-L-arabinose transferase-like glycosyltransferase